MTDKSECYHFSALFQEAAVEFSNLTDRKVNPTEPVGLEGLNPLFPCELRDCSFG